MRNEVAILPEGTVFDEEKYQVFVKYCEANKLMEHECKGNGSYNKGSRLAACICNEFKTIEVC